MRAINDINAPKGLDLSWRLQSLANMAKQKIGPLLGFSGVLIQSLYIYVPHISHPSGGAIMDNNLVCLSTLPFTTMW